SQPWTTLPAMAARDSSPVRSPVRGPPATRSRFGRIDRSGSSGACSASDRSSAAPPSERSSAPRSPARLPWGSRSTASTRHPEAAASPARLAASDVLRTPPLPLDTISALGITFATPIDSTPLPRRPPPPHVARVTGVDGGPAGRRLPDHRPHGGGAPVAPRWDRGRPAADGGPTVDGGASPQRFPTVGRATDGRAITRRPSSVGRAVTGRRSPVGASPTGGRSTVRAVTDRTPWRGSGGSRPGPRPCRRSGTRNGPPVTHLDRRGPRRRRRRAVGARR